MEHLPLASGQCRGVPGLHLCHTTCLGCGGRGRASPTTIGGKQPQVVLLSTKRTKGINHNIGISCDIRLRGTILKS